MRTVWKYPLPLDKFNNAETSTNVALRQGCEILDIQLQDNTPTMWVALDPQATTKMVEIIIVGTGQSVPSHADEFISTVQDGAFVWHFFVGRQ